MLRLVSRSHQIPDHIRNSEVLTGNNLGRLGNVEELPTQEEVAQYATLALVKEAKTKGTSHLLAKQLLEKGEVMNAWKVLLG